MTAGDIGPLDLNPSPLVMRRLALSIRSRDYDIASDHRKDESEEQRTKRLNEEREEHKEALNAALGEIAHRIRDYRGVQPGFTQDHLARMVGRSQSHVVKVESKTGNPTLKTLLLFKAALEKEWLESQTDAHRLMTPHEEMVWVNPDTPLLKAAAIMRARGFSQLPIHKSFDDAHPKAMLELDGFKGFLLDSALLEEGVNLAHGKVKNVKTEGVDWRAPSDSKFEALRQQMAKGKGALVIHERVGRSIYIIGIMTKTDLLSEDFMQIR